jgi:hypothetical protein
VNSHVDSHSNEHVNSNFNSHVYIRYDYKHLPDDYEEWLLSPSGDKSGSFLAEYTTIPFKDGSYMKFDLNTIEDNLLDFVHRFGIKCTGVDLARRDQFKFINFNHLLTFANDLRYTPDTNLDTVNITATNDSKFKLWEPVHQLLLNFAGIEIMKNINDMTSKYEKDWLNWHPFKKAQESVFYPWNEISDSCIMNLKKSNVIYTYKDFPLEFYAKIVKYSDKDNGMKEIVGKLTSMINDAGMEVNALLSKINDIIHKYNIKDIILNNVTSIDEIKYKIFPHIESLKIEPLTREIKSLIENRDAYSYKSKLETIMPNYDDRVPFLIINPNNDKLTITSSKGNDQFNIRKDQGYMLDQLRILFTDDEIYSLLDYKFYFNQLATSLCNYLAIEYDPSIADFLDEQYQLLHPELSLAQIKEQMDKRISKSIENIKKPIINRYYPQETLQTIKKKVGIKKINNVTCDYNRINELNEVLSPYLGNISIKNLDVMSINDPYTACSYIINVNNVLNKYYSQSLTKLRSHISLNCPDHILNDLNELIEIYECLLNNLSKYVMNKSDEKVKVFIWYDKTIKCKSRSRKSELEDELIVYKIDASSNKKMIRNKQLFTYEVPKYLLTTGGIRMNRTERFMQLLSAYLNHFTWNEEFIKVCSNGEIKIKPEHVNDMLEFIKQFILLLNE